MTDRTIPRARTIVATALLAISVTLSAACSKSSPTAATTTSSSEPQPPTASTQQDTSQTTPSTTTDDSQTTPSVTPSSMSNSTNPDVNKTTDPSRKAAVDRLLAEYDEPDDPTSAAYLACLEEYLATVPDEQVTLLDQIYQDELQRDLTEEEAEKSFAFVGKTLECIQIDPE